MFNKRRPKKDLYGYFIDLYELYPKKDLYIPKGGGPGWIYIDLVWIYMDLLSTYLNYIQKRIYISKTGEGGGGLRCLNQSTHLY